MKSLLTKSPVLKALGAIIVLVAFFFVLDRLIFLARAEGTTGEVSELSSRNSRCGGRRSRYDCTIFSAKVVYQHIDHKRQLTVSAGRARGHGRSTVAAGYRIGSPVPIIYSPSGYTAYRNSFGDIWGKPLMGFFVGIVCLFSRDRKRNP